MKNKTLTPMEQLYFEALKKADGAVMPSHILAEITPPAPVRDSNVVNVHVMNMRRKLSALGYSIKTVRGVGYQLEKI